jgi:hypothetical protein
VEVTPESHPFNAADHSAVPQDLAADNYIEEEYFISGRANVYDYDADGKVFVRTPDAPYTTRVLIRRPADRSRFSGNVIVELNNPTAMYDMDLQWMGPSSRGNDTTAETENGLVWDIVSQVGALLRSDREANPIRDYNAEYVIATGYSQTGGYLSTYINLIQPLDRARLADGSPIYDGYMIGDGDAFMVPLNQCVERIPPGETGVKIKPRGVPVISVVTQGLLSMTAAARRPDSDAPEDRFRRYEIPGAAHVNRISNDRKPCPADIEKAGVPSSPANCEGIAEYGVTDFPLEYFMDSAYSNLYNWLRTGTPPPVAKPIITKKGDRNTGIVIKLDENGNAMGGVRNPYVDVPLATWYGQSRPLDRESSFFCSLAGYRKPFDNDKIKNLYPTGEDYQGRVTAMVDSMVKERFLTVSDGERIKKEAEGAQAWQDKGGLQFMDSGSRVRK